MGTKLKDIDFSDSIFDSIRDTPSGISGGCYCCSQQIHIEIDQIYTLPSAKINSKLYQVLLCDLCEMDIYYLEDMGIEDVSYDVLFFLQEALREKLFEAEGKDGDISDEDRARILAELYNIFDKRYKKIREEA